MAYIPPESPVLFQGRSKPRPDYPAEPWRRPDPPLPDPMKWFWCALVTAFVGTLTLAILLLLRLHTPAVELLERVTQ